MLHRTHHHGYILLMTLVLLAIAALATVGASRVAMHAARVANDGEEELQRHWGQLSIEHYLLPAAENILSADEKAAQQPMVSSRHSLQLGEITFDLIISDEQAKPNANAFLKNRQRTDAETELRQALSGMVPASMILLKPMSVGTGLADPVMSYSQVYDAMGPPQLITSRIGSVCPADALTCWGSGQVNVRRASLNTLRAVLTNAAGTGAAERVVALRSATPPLSLDQMLIQMDLKADQRQKVAAILIDHSSCHSVWIISKSVAGASRYRLSVAIQGNTRITVPMTFEW